jgi:ABC-type amino acid transport substrate-binding protein
MRLRKITKLISAWFAPVFVTIIVAAAVSGCGKTAVPTPRAGVAAPQSPFASFRDIPGVTMEEIAAIEALQRDYASFSYGMTLSSEAFYDENGEVGGFSALFIGWLSGLFGVPFKPAIYEWSDMIEGLETGRLDFAGNLTASAERRKTYFMTDAIARRSLKYMRIAGSRPLAEIAISGPLRHAFLNGTTTLDLVSPYLKDEYVPFFVDDYGTVYDMLKNGEVDTFIIEGPDEAAFNIYGSVVSSDFFPLIYTPVSLSTRNPALEPVISVFQKVLETDCTTRYLAELYNQGNQE